MSELAINDKVTKIAKFFQNYRKSKTDQNGKKRQNAQKPEEPNYSQWSNGKKCQIVKTGLFNQNNQKAK